MPSSATITSSDLIDFQPKTVIKSAEVDGNFSIWRGHNLPVNPNTSAAADSTYDLGSTEYKWETLHADRIYNGTGSQDASALLELESTTKGVVFPRMTEAQRDAISSPVTGLIIYNTTDGNYDFYDGSSWIAILNSYVSANSSAFALSTAGYASGEFAQMSGNTVTLEKGSWLLTGGGIFDNTGATAQRFFCEWHLANGDNTGTPPTSISSILDAGNSRSSVNDLTQYTHIPAQTIRVTVASSTNVYLNTSCVFTVAGSGTMTTKIYGERLIV